MSNNQVDQDALAAEWGLALDGDAPAPKAEIKEAAKPKAAEPTSDDDLAAAWADAIEESGGGGGRMAVPAVAAVRAVTTTSRPTGPRWSTTPRRRTPRAPTAS